MTIEQELRDALEAAVDLIQSLPTLNGLYGLSVFEHCRGLLELLPITDDVTEGMLRAGIDIAVVNGVNNISGSAVRDIYTRMRSVAPRQPIPMVLYCPNCGMQHIDKADPPHWLNPPHRSHLCPCGWQWRPSDTPTTGIAALGTVGERDSKGEPRLARHAAYWRYTQRSGYFCLPPPYEGDLWAVGVGSTRADNCHFGDTFEQALNEALKRDGPASS